MQNLSDNELVQLYINGNEAPLAILIQRHKRKIFSYIYIITRDKALSEDVFQDTFFKVIQTLKRGQYNEEGKFLPWVLRISKNLVIDHFRRLKKMPTIPVVVNEEGEETEIFDLIPGQDHVRDEHESNEFRRHIRGLVNDLPAEQREVVVMRTYYDMSFKEISEFTNVSINTSLGRMRYALINLKKMMEEKNMEVYI